MLTNSEPDIISSTGRSYRRDKGDNGALEGVVITGRRAMVRRV